MKLTFNSSTSDGYCMAVVRPNEKSLNKANIDVNQSKIIISRLSRKLENWTHFASSDIDVFASISNSDNSKNSGKHALRNLGKELAHELIRNKINVLSLDASEDAFWIT